MYPVAIRLFSDFSGKYHAFNESQRGLKLSGKLHTRRYTPPDCYPIAAILGQTCEGESD